MKLGAPSWKRATLLSAVLVVGCAMLPLASLEPAQVRYVVMTDWDGVALQEGERVFETDLGYTVGLSSFQLHTTSIELIACAPETAAWNPGPGRAYAHGGTYEHDISAVEPGLDDDLMLEEAQARGTSVATRSHYCELYTVHGSGNEDAIASIDGWYRAPGSDEEVPFTASHPLGLAEITPLPLGTANDALLPDEAEVVVTRFPARAFDGLELDDLPEIDLAYEVSRAVLQTRELSWTMGPALSDES